MSENQICELCLESLGVPPNVAHMIQLRFHRDAATIELLHLRISQLQETPKTPPHAHPTKRKSHGDCQRSHCAIKDK